MKKHVEISVIVCAMIMILGGGGCSTKSPNHCKSNDLCVPETDVLKAVVAIVWAKIHVIVSTMLRQDAIHLPPR